MKGSLIALIGIILYGQATFYDQGVFQRVWQYRQRTMPVCEECIGFAAMMDCENLGDQVWISNEDEWIGPLYVIDCAASHDVELARERGRIIEVDSWLAQRWGMRGPIDVRVWKSR